MPRLRLVPVALLALAMFSGCGGDGKLKVYVVKGQVLYNKEPLKGVDLAFHATNKSSDAGFPPHAKTDENGNFQLTTYLKDDGAPAGEFKVSIAFAAEVAGEDDGSDQTRKIIAQVPVKYHKKETTPFTVTIKPEANTLEPFALEGPPFTKKR